MKTYEYSVFHIYSKSKQIPTCGLNGDDKDCVIWALAVLRWQDICIAAVHPTLLRLSEN